MLNGIAPIIIFNFKKALVDLNLFGLLGGERPLLPDDLVAIPLLPIPIYLDERLTGIIITEENKNIDILTESETKPDGTEPDVVQKGVNSTVSINMKASRGSIGLTVLSAMSDQIFQKVTSREYSVTYINGAVTVFNGLLQSFSINQSENDDAYRMTMVISKAKGGSTIEKVTPTILNKSAPVGL